MVVVFVDGKQQKCDGSGGSKVIEMWWRWSCLWRKSNRNVVVVVVVVEGSK